MVSQETLFICLIIHLKVESIIILGNLQNVEVYIGINTGLPNKIVKEAIEEGRDS